MIGANSVPLWQSYIAGLDPSDPASQFRFQGKPAPDGMGYVLHWTAVAGHLYTIWGS